MNRFETLLAGYLDHTLTPGEAQELAHLVKQDRELADQLVEHYTHHRRLDFLLREPADDFTGGVMARIKEDGDEFVGAVVEELRASGPARSPWTPFVKLGWPVTWALAASLLVVLGLAIGLAGSRGGAAPLLAGFSSGGVTLFRAGQAMPVTGGVTLRVGDVVETAGHARATIQYAGETTRIELRANTRLRVADWRAGKRLALEQGRLAAAVASQPAGRPLVVATPQATATVLGTEFTLAAGPQATQLEVQTGRVRFADDSRRGVVTVPAGHFAVAAANVELEARLVIRALNADETGGIRREFWTGIRGAAVADLTGHASFANEPAGSELLASFEAPFNAGEDYGARLRGYLLPPATGEYTFWIAADDSAELWLSPDESPAGKTRVAAVSFWTEPRGWTQRPGQQSAPIRLTAGRKYYIEALHKQSRAGDCLAVAWRGPGLPLEVIPGKHLSPFPATRAKSKP